MTYRMIDTNMWLDPWFEEASPDEKLLFVYLFTNPYCSSAGAAQYSHKRLSNETGIPRERVNMAIEAMTLAGKILVDGDWIVCRAFIKHQTRNGNFALSVSKAISEIGSATIQQQVSNLIPTPKQHHTNPEATSTRGGRKADHTPLQEQDQDQDQGQEQRETEIPVPSDKPKKRSGPLLVDEEWISQLKANPAYSGIDIDKELGKMRAWLTTPRGAGKTMTRQRVINWLNRAEPSGISGPSLASAGAERDLAKESEQWLLDNGYVDMTHEAKP